MDPFAFALSLCCAAATEAAWRTGRQEFAAAGVPDRATVGRHWRANQAYRRELIQRLEILPNDRGTLDALEDAWRRSDWIDAADRAHGCYLSDAEKLNPWVRLYHLHRYRDMVGDASFYLGPVPPPVNPDYLPWYSGGRGVLVGVPEPGETGEEP